MKNQSPNLESLLSKYQDQLGQLTENITEIKSKGRANDRDEALLASFASAHDLAIELIKTYFSLAGRGAFSGSRDATIEAFNEDLIDDGACWLDMIIDRIKSDPLYPENHQDKQVHNILTRYLPALQNFERKLLRRIE
jgi:hypothetical protein